jgi:hypothetical protein
MITFNDIAILAGLCVFLGGVIGYAIGLADCSRMFRSTDQGPRT